MNLIFKDVAERTNDDQTQGTTDEEAEHEGISTVTTEEGIMGDTTTIAYASCLKKLAEIKIPDTCKVGNTYYCLSLVFVNVTVLTVQNQHIECFRICLMIAGKLK